jgi:hypothetical protein
MLLRGMRTPWGPATSGGFPVALPPAGLYHDQHAGSLLQGLSTEIHLFSVPSILGNARPDVRDVSLEHTAVSRQDDRERPYDPFRLEENCVHRACVGPAPVAAVACRIDIAAG